MAHLDAEIKLKDVQEEKTPPINSSQVSTCDEHKQKETDSAQNDTAQNEHPKVTDVASSLNSDINNTEDTDTDEVKGQVLNREVENCTSDQDNDRSHGDHREEASSSKTPTPKPDEISNVKEEKTPLIDSSQDSASDEHDQKENDPAQNDHTEEEDHREEDKPQETSSSPTQRKGSDDEVDRHELKSSKEPWDRDITNIGEDVGKEMEKVLVPEAGKDVKKNTACPQTASFQEDAVEKEKFEQISDGVEIIGPATEEKTAEPKVPEATGFFGGNAKYWIIVFTVALISVLVHHLLHSESPPEKKDLRKVDIFLRELEIVKTQFPSQHPELWRRSRIHMARHLQTAQPTEPVSLILTAGRRAERTLHCLAQGLASAFSAALNSSVLQIDGASKAVQDSDQVKLDIDRQLRAAFEGDKHVAVVHRFEELPPASTLIFYRYCDHENAAYKKTSLIFTVLLGGEEELPAHLGLSAVEEMVDDQLQKKFLSSSHSIAFNSMDLDKYSGLWSRISHLILPVAADERIEHKGC